VQPVGLEFRALLKSPAVTGEDPDSSRDLLGILGFGEEARKSVAQHFGLLTAQRAGFLVRASSLKGLLRVASEYAVELKSLSLGLGHAVCSFLDVGGVGTPKCVLPPPPPEDELRKVLEGERWVTTSRDRVEFNNYPCVPCSVFGATGLKSMVSVSFNGSFAREVKPRSFHRLFFNEVMRRELQGRDVRPLLIHALGAGGEIALRVTLAGGGPRGLRSKSCPPRTLAAAVLWLAVQLVNAGFFRLGRFKSRGLGVLQIAPTKDTLSAMAQLLEAEETGAGVTAKANEVLESELKARLGEARSGNPPS
jgi:CRISPR/Cas system CSM-associated protein Csm3 (group 7 of RAMP superfamily)